MPKNLSVTLNASGNLSSELDDVAEAAGEAASALETAKQAVSDISDDMRSAAQAAESLKENISDVSQSSSVAGGMTNLFERALRNVSATGSIAAESIEGLSEEEIKSAFTALQSAQSHDQMEEQIEEARTASLSLSSALGAEQSSALAAAIANNIAADSLDEMGDEAAEARDKMAGAASMAELLSLKSNALSINIGAFTIALRNLTTQVPLLVASLGNLATAFGGVSAAIGASAVGGLGLAIGGAVAQMEEMTGEAASLEERMQAMQAIGQEFLSMLREAIEPLVEMQDAAELFKSLLEGIASTVRAVSQAIADSYQNGPLREAIQTISDAWMDSIVAIGDAFQFMIARLQSAGFFEFIADGIRRLDDFIVFVTGVMTDMMAILGQVNEDNALSDFFVQLMELGRQIATGLAPLISDFLRIVSQVAAEITALGSGSIGAAIQVVALAIAFNKLLSIGAAVVQPIALLVGHLSSLTFQSQTTSSAFVRMASNIVSGLSGVSSGFGRLSSSIASAIPMMEAGENNLENLAEELNQTGLAARIASRAFSSMSESIDTPSINGQSRTSKTITTKINSNVESVTDRFGVAASEIVSPIENAVQSAGRSLSVLGAHFIHTSRKPTTLTNSIRRVASTAASVTFSAFISSLKLVASTALTAITSLGKLVRVMVMAGASALKTAQSIGTTLVDAFLTFGAYVVSAFVTLGKFTARVLATGAAAVNTAGKILYLAAAMAKFSLSSRSRLFTTLSLAIQRVGNSALYAAGIIRSGLGSALESSKKRILDVANYVVGLSHKFVNLATDAVTASISALRRFNSGVGSRIAGTLNLIGSSLYDVGSSMQRFTFSSLSASSVLSSLGNVVLDTAKKSSILTGAYSSLTSWTLTSRAVTDDLADDMTELAASMDRSSEAGQRYSGALLSLSSVLRGNTSVTSGLRNAYASLAGMSTNASNKQLLVATSSIVASKAVNVLKFSVSGLLGVLKKLALALTLAAGSMVAVVGVIGSVAAGLMLLGESGKSSKDIISGLKEVLRGIAQRLMPLFVAAGNMMIDVGRSIVAVGKALIGAFLDVGRALGLVRKSTEKGAGGIKGFMQSLSQAVSVIVPVIKYIGDLVRFMAGAFIRSLRDATKMFVGFLKALNAKKAISVTIDTVKSVIEVIGGIKKAMKGVVSFVSDFVSGIIKITAILGTLAFVAGIATMGVTGLGIAIAGLFSPVTLIVGAVVALVSIVIVLVERLGILDLILDVIMGTIGLVVDLTMALFDAIIDATKAILGFFKVGAVIGWLADIFGVLWDTIKGVVDAGKQIFNVFMDIFGVVMKMAGGIVNILIKKGINGLIKGFNIVKNVILTTITSILEFLKTIPFVTKIISGLQKGFDKIVSSVKGFIKIIKNLPSIISDVIKKAFGWIEGVINSAISLINAAIKTYNSIPGTDDIDTVGKVDLEFGGGSGGGGGGSSGGGSKPKDSSKSAKDMMSGLDVMKNLKNDATKPEMGGPATQINYREGDQNQVYNQNVNAQPEDKPKIKRIMKDAMEEANSFRRHNQGNGG